MGIYTTSDEAQLKVHCVSQQHVNKNTFSLEEKKKKKITYNLTDVYL